jgi:hypothetical protein
LSIAHFRHALLRACRIEFAIDRDRHMAKYKRAIRWSIAVLIVLAGLWLVLPMVLAPILRSKLNTLVNSHLNAELRIGSLRYSFPYGVRARDVHLISNSDQNELFSADRVDLSLVQLPIRKGPLLIQRIDLKNPAIHIIQNSDGSLAGKNMLRPHPEEQPTSQKISDILQLRRFSISGGQIRYEDAAHAAPMVWQNLAADIHLKPTSGSQYSWDFTAVSAPAAKISSNGTIDVDQAVLDISKLNIVAEVDHDKGNSALPSQVQKFLKTLGAAGTADFRVSAHVPLKDLPAAQIQASLDLKDLHADLDGSPVSGDVQFTVDKQANNPQVRLEIPKLAVKTDAGNVNVRHLTAEVDSRRGAWRVSDFTIEAQPPNHSGSGGVTRIIGSMVGTGKAIQQYDLLMTLDDLSLTPHGLELPIEHINGTIHASNGAIVADRISATFGDDRFRVQTATIPLEHLTDKIQFRDLYVSISFHQPSPHYPGDLRRLIAQLNPAGSYDIHGNYTFTFHGPDESNLTLISNDAALAIGPKRIPITNLQSEILLTSDQAQIHKFSGDLFGGTISGSGNVGVNKPNPFQANVTLHNVDLQKAAVNFIVPDSGPQKLSGIADAALNGTGTVDDLNSINGHGEVKVTDGQLWQIKLLDGMVSRTKIARNALTPGDAAAVFDVADKQVQISAAAINSPALGFQGNGTVGFDGQLDLNVIVAPLGDWQAQMKKTGIPIISGIASNLAGGIQKFLASATSNLLYQFHVTGSASEPKVEAVPAPFLSDHSAEIFANMMKKKQDLLETIRQMRE